MIYFLNPSWPLLFWRQFLRQKVLHLESTHRASLRSRSVCAISRQPWAPKSPSSTIWACLRSNARHWPMPSSPNINSASKIPCALLTPGAIDLCLELFPWAKFRQTKGAVKLHCQLDIKGQIPSFAVVTDGKCSNIRAAKAFLDLMPDSIYVVDR